MNSSGIVGLVREPMLNGDLLIKKLYKDGVIEGNMFSLLLTSNQTKQSVMTVGGYSTDRYAKNKQALTWHEVDFRLPYWTLQT